MVVAERFEDYWRDEDRALDRLSELPHVSGPRLPLEPGQRATRQTDRVAPILRGGRLEETRGEQGNVLSAVAQQCITRSFAAAPASVVIPFQFLKLPFVAIIAFLWFMEEPDPWTWLGALVIFGATYAIARDDWQPFQEGGARAPENPGAAQSLQLAFLLLSAHAYVHVNAWMCLRASAWASLRARLQGL